MPFVIEDDKTAIPTTGVQNPQNQGRFVIEEQPAVQPEISDGTKNIPFSPLTRMFGSGFKKTLEAVPSSAERTGQSIISGIKHPIDTVKTLTGIAAGGVEKGLEAVGIEPRTTEQEAEFDAFTKILKDRYGSLDKLRNTVETDPVGFAMDLSAGIGTLGKTAEITGTASKAAGLAKMGEAATDVSRGLFRASRGIDPTVAAGKGIQMAAKVGGQTLAEVLGVTTGAGAETIRQAARGTEAFGKAMRGQIPERNIVQTAQDAFSSLIAERGKSYRSALSKIKESNKVLDITPVYHKLYDLYRQFNVTFDEDLKLSNLRSELTDSEIKDVQDLTNMVTEWGSKEENLTPGQLDILKKKIDNYITDPAFPKTTRIEAFAMGVKDSLRSILNKNVPRYEKMTSAYEHDTKDLIDIKKALSLDPKTGADTILRKLNTAMRESPEFRRNLIDKLERDSGKDVMSLIGGISASGWSPGGRLGPITMTTADVAASIASGHLQYLALLPLASPRLVGEFVHNLAVASKAAAPYAERIPFRPLGQAAFQAGRLGETGPETIGTSQDSGQ